MSDVQDQGRIVQVTFVEDIPEDRAEEYIEANYSGEHVKITDRHTGDVLAERGEFPRIICPDCGDEAIGIVSSGGTDEYLHAGRKRCEVA